MTAAEERLMSMWEQWDERPSDHHRAGLMQMAAELVAVERGCGVMGLREQLAASTRGGSTRRQAIERTRRTP